MDHERFSRIPLMRTKTENTDTPLYKLKSSIERKYRLKFGTSFDFHKWTIENVKEFWSEIWDFLGIICSRKYDEVINLNLPMNEAPKWFEGARMNYAENLLKYKDDRVALITQSEEVGPEKITYRQLHEEVRVYAAAFRKFGLRQGDVVACYLPNRKEAVIAMLAVVSIGAIWTGAVPLLGPQAVLTRFQLVSPRILLTIDRFQHDGEEKKMLNKVKEISESLKSLEKVLIVSTNKDVAGIREIPNSCFLENFLKTGVSEGGSVPALSFEQVSFSHPVIINFTSGTTGKPKAILHGFGALIPSVKDFGIQVGSTRESIWLAMSPVGWVSWTIAIGLLFCGCTVVLYEGEPYFLSPTYLWDLVVRLRITHLFLPTSVADKIQQLGYKPTLHHDLSHVTTCLVGGSFVKPQIYDFIYNQVQRDILCSSCYGSTEAVGMCLVPDSTVDIYRGELPIPCFGLDLQCVDQKGIPVEGEMGELVIGTPYPTLLLGLWGDADGSVFREAYFSNHDGKFAVKDFAVINPITKGFVVLGRSDDTLKQRGTRFGCTEIYSIIDELDEICDSLCVAHFGRDQIERAVLFVKMNTGYVFDSQLVHKLRQVIGTELTPAHVPEVILEVKDVPYNTNRKKMESIVKNIINKRPYNAESIVNPECLRYFEQLQELEQF